MAPLSVSRLSIADPAARFTGLGPGWHDEQADREREIRNHLRQVKAPPST
jgi:hypothetical protein